MNVSSADRKLCVELAEITMDLNVRMANIATPSPEKGKEFGLSMNSNNSPASEGDIFRKSMIGGTEENCPRAISAQRRGMPTNMYAHR